MEQVAVSLDEAVAALEAGRPMGRCLFRGRLRAPAPLLSPGGVPCAFYDAEICEVGPDGRKGALLLHERALPSPLRLQGEQIEATVCVTLESVRAPLEVRRCAIPQEVLDARWQRREPLPEDVLAWERVGGEGAECLVLGELVPGDAPGTYAIRGRWGGGARVLVGEAADASSGLLSARAGRRAVAVSAALLGLASMMLLLA